MIKYYSEHQKEFMLKDFIVKPVYFKFHKSVKELDKVKAWYGLSNDTDLENLLNFASHYAENFYYDPSSWVYMADVLKEVPLKDVNQENIIRNKSKVSFEDEEFVYFLKVTDFRMKDAVSPLSLEREKIVSIIINDRMSELRDQLRNSLYDDAVTGQNVELY